MILFVLGLVLGAMPITAEVWPLVLINTPVPGTAGFQFTGFSQAFVNTSGTIAFHASFVAPGNVPGQGIFEITAGELKPVMLSGQLVPDTVESAFGASGDARINSAGDIVFIAHTNQRPGFRGIFLRTGGSLRRIVDQDSPVPGSPERRFEFFFDPQINDQGDIAFGATLVGTSPSQGVFLISNGNLQAIAGSEVDSRNFSLNNSGDILLNSFGSLLVSSGGSTKSVIPLPADSTGATSLSMNDDGDVAFIGTRAVPAGRGTFVLRDKIVRWRNGSIETVVSAGDPVPGFEGGTFDSQFVSSQVNRSGIIFQDLVRRPGSSQVGIIAKYQDGRVISIAHEDQYIDGIGTLDFIGQPNFDRQQGQLITFLANAAGGTRTGIYAATADPRYTLRFPHIADGGGSGLSGWRTTFVLANRSTSNALATLSFYDSAGVPLSLKVGGVQVSQTTVVVPALGVARVQTQGGPSLLTGWAQLESDENLSGIAIFGLNDASGSVVSEVGSPATLALRSMSLLVLAGVSTSTGVALANPNSIPVDVTLILRDSNSTELARTSLRLNAMGHVARYAGELFPGIVLGEFDGKIDVLATQPLAALTLRQRELVFTSLPVIP